MEIARIEEKKNGIRVESTRHAKSRGRPRIKSCSSARSKVEEVSRSWNELEIAVRPYWKMYYLSRGS
jgi:hypothetical protein